MVIYHGYPTMASSKHIPSQYRAAPSCHAHGDADKGDNRCHEEQDHAEHDNEDDRVVYTVRLPRSARRRRGCGSWRWSEWKRVNVPFATLPEWMYTAWNWTTTCTCELMVNHPMKTPLTLIWQQPYWRGVFFVKNWHDKGGGRVELAIPGLAVKCFTTEPSLLTKGWNGQKLEADLMLTVR